MLMTKLSRKERLFCIIAYFPKATAQEVIGAFPLAMGLDFGQIALSVALLGILFTASLDALGIDSSCRYLLCKQ